MNLALLALATAAFAIGTGEFVIVGLLPDLSMDLRVHGPVSAMVTLFAWGTAAFTLVPPLLLGVVEQASDAPNLASTMNQGAFNLGNATGAWLGGVAVLRTGDGAGGYAVLPLPGATLAALALALAVLAFWSERKSRRAGIVDA